MNGPLVFRKDLMVSELDEGKAQKGIVIKNPVTEQFFYMPQREYHLLQKFDGSTNVEEAIRELREQGHHYSMDEATEMLERASGLGLLLGSPISSAVSQLFLRNKMTALTRMRKMMSPFSFYLPLLNPDHFLDRTVFFANLLFNRWTLLFWLALGVCSLYLVLGNIGRIANEHLALLSARDLMMVWPGIVVTRLAHELGHAYAAKAYGLEVKTLGIAMLILFPCPYIDTTDAWKLSRRWQRITIGAAGIIAEMIIASLCVLIWFFSKPGLLNYLSFYVMTISAVSTLAFNANPLIKFDGYFILSDYLRVPNLAARSFQYVRSLALTKLLGVPLCPLPQIGLRKALIFVVYGISSLCYRMTLYGAITAALYYRFDKVLGLLLAAYSVTMFIVRPVVKGMKELWVNRSRMTHSRKTWMRLGLISTIIATAMLWPWSYNATFACRVDSHETRAISIPVNAIVSNIFIREGCKLVRGETMFELDTTVLEFELRRAKFEKEIIDLQIKTLVLDQSDLAKLPQKSLELRTINEAISRMARDLQTSLEATKAPFDCVVTRLDPRLKPGFQVGEAAVVGQVKSTASRVVIALLPDSLLGKIVQGQQVQVLLPWGEGRPITSTMNLSMPCPASHRDQAEIASLSANMASKRLSPKESQRLASDGDSEYVWSAELPMDQDAPLGMTGRVSIAFVPENIVSRLYGYVIRTANRESFF